MSAFPRETRRLPIVALGYAIALCVLVVASIWLTRSPLGVALMWPVNAVAIAILQGQPKERWPVWIAATAAALIGANLPLNQTMMLSVGFTLINLTEIVIGAVVIRWLGLDPRTPKGYFAIVGSATATATFCAVMAALLLAGTEGAPLVRTAQRWFAADLMGMAILLPALLIVRCDGMAGQPWRRRAEIVLIPVAVAAVAYVAFHLPYPSLFLLMPCAVFAAFRQKFLGAVISVTTTAGIATYYTLSGDGPIARLTPALDDRVLYLQIFLAAVTLTAFPVATLLHQRRKTLIAIREAEQQSRLLTDHSTDMIVRIGMDGIRQYVSPASIRVLGYRPDELIGDSPVPMIHPDDREHAETTCRSLLDGVAEPVATYRQRHRDGHYVWLEAAYRLVMIDGRPAGVVASVRDVSRRHAAEQSATEALAKLQERQRLLTMAETTAQIGHWRLNFADNTVYWSPEVFRIHGLAPGDAPTLDQSIERYHPDDRDKVRSQVEEALQSGTDFRFVARLLRSDGAIRWVESRGQAECAPTGDVLGLFGVFHDITEQVAAVAELTTARESAERALEAKAVFTATMSHEIRTPLTSILAVTELLRDTRDPVEHARHLDTLGRAGRMLSDVIDDVLIFSKLEAGHVAVEAVAFVLGDVVEDVAMMFAADAAARDVTIAVDLDHDAGRMTGDPVRLRRVLTNLVGNAVKFTRAGQVTIRALRGDVPDCWRFEVADTGVGIRADRLDAIFSPFVQADASTTRSYGGTGLGLSICRMLVQAMGGEIGVNSAPGAGSCFWFTVHLPAAPAAEAADQPDPEPAGDRRSLNVLVAEDNRTNRYLIGELVRRLGHRVIEAENGARAVERVTDPAGGGIDIVLMDIQMPVMDGIAATRAIRAWCGSGAKVPVHALTADLSSERRAEIFAVGMNGVLAKPVDLAALRRLLDGADEGTDVTCGTAEAVIDPDRIAALAATLGTASRDRLLSLLVDDAQRAPAEIRQMVASGEWAAARMRAHGLRGAVAGVGGSAVTTILHAIEAGHPDAPIDPALIDRLDHSAATLIQAVSAILDPA